MSDLKNEFIFTLSGPLKYSNNGVFEFTNELILKAPSNKQRRESAKLKQGFFRALKSMQDSIANKPVDDSVKPSNDDGIDADGIMPIIMMSDVDLCEFQDDFRSLLLNDACIVNETIKLTAPMYDSLSDCDTEKMMGEYLANFLLSSSIKKMQGKK